MSLPASLPFAPTDCEDQRPAPTLTDEDLRRFETAVPGLRYRRGYLTAGQGAWLLRWIDRHPARPCPIPLAPRHPATQIRPLARRPLP